MQIILNANRLYELKIFLSDYRDLSSVNISLSLFSGFADTMIFIPLASCSAVPSRQLL
jgi:hypothetical protein